MIQAFSDGEVGKMVLHLAIHAMAHDALGAIAPPVTRRRSLGSMGSDFGTNLSPKYHADKSGHAEGKLGQETALHPIAHGITHGYRSAFQSMPIPLGTWVRLWDETTPAQTLDR